MHHQQAICLFDLIITHHQATVTLQYLHILIIRIFRSILQQIKNNADQISSLTLFSLVIRNLNLSIINSGLNITGTVSIDRASDGVTGSKNLLNSSRKLLSHGALQFVYFLAQAADL